MFTLLEIVVQVGLKKGTRHNSFLERIGACLPFICVYILWLFHTLSVMWILPLGTPFTIPSWKYIPKTTNYPILGASALSGDRYDSRVPVNLFTWWLRRLPAPSLSLTESSTAPMQDWECRRDLAAFTRRIGVLIDQPSFDLTRNLANACIYHTRCVRLARIGILGGTVNIVAGGPNTPLIDTAMLSAVILCMGQTSYTLYQQYMGLNMLLQPLVSEIDHKPL